MFVETCSTCKMQFGMPDEFQKTARQMAEKLTLYCPAGHGQVYTTGESETTKLRRERDRLKQDNARLEDYYQDAERRATAAKHSATAYKGVATRIKKRLNHGVCPCCNRTFVNLAMHMQKQHPDSDNIIEFGQVTA